MRVLRDGVPRRLLPADELADEHEIGLAELGANSVLSVGGAGGLALGAWILRRGGLTVEFIARRTVAFFLITSAANTGFLVLGGVGLATGVLGGSPSWWLGAIPAVCAVVVIGSAVGARRLVRRVGRARVIADGVDEALRLLRTGEPLIWLGAAGYMLFDVAMLGVCFTAFGNRSRPSACCWSPTSSGSSAG